MQLKTWTLSLTTGTSPGKGVKLLPLPLPPDATRAGSLLRARPILRALALGAGAMAV